ncbi:hypothetical protein MWU78_03225 [Arenibacter sp. F26102]|uniref:hypothetical protein n=1 Tax=Arenibacter sp. F26102 TaxID=2926416 RepID=UPI001FF6E77F|nr:hypothetical protein [Arenibacter sp. F26102]MCK0144655.1 hypothetical protein [Arenibacter sp. F26102]
MKKTYILSLFLALFALNTSCDDDGGTSAIPTTNGALPDFAVVAGSPAFIDLTGLNDLNLNFTVGVGVGTPASFDLKAFYLTVDGDLYGPVTLDSGVTEFPKEYTLTGTELIGSFSELTSADDIQVGDMLKLYTSYTFKDGSVLEVLNSKAEPNYYAADFNQITEFKISLDYIVSCPSDLGGNYSVVSSGTSTDGAPVNNPLVDFAYDVVVTDNGGGNYSISDGVAGVYQDWYCEPYGYCFETAGTMTDVCGDLTGTWTESFSCEINLTGTVNPDGTLSIQWENCFGDSATAVYTPQ